MQSIWSPEVIIHGGEFIILVFGGWVGLKIREAVAGVRAEQTQVKTDLMQSQNQLQHDFDAKHAENREEIAAHVASDDQQFKYIGQSLDRIEKKVDERNGRY